MPLGKNVSKNIKELYKDNKKKGKARGAKGKKRSRKQILAIAMHSAGKGRKMNVAIHKGEHMMNGKMMKNNKMKG